MPIQISRIVLASNRPSRECFYFKIEASDVFISKATQTNNIQQQLDLNLNSMTPVIFEIWNYQTIQIIRSWTISQHSLCLSTRKYLIKDAEWSIRFQITKEEQEVSQAKQNKVSKDNKTASSSKDLKVMDKKKHRNKSGYKEVNLSVLKKNKDKVGVKKALKTTIDYLIKQDKKKKKCQDYKVQGVNHVKSAHISPNFAPIHGAKNQSVLYSQYGFSSSELNLKYLSKERSTTVDDETDRFVIFEKKKKTKGR